MVLASAIGISTGIAIFQPAFKEEKEQKEQAQYIKYPSLVFWEYTYFSAG